MSNHYLPRENNRQVSFHCSSAFSCKEILCMNSIVFSLFLTTAVQPHDTTRVYQSVCLSFSAFPPPFSLSFLSSFVPLSFFLSPPLCFFLSFNMQVRSSVKFQKVNRPLQSAPRFRNTVLSAPRILLLLPSWCEPPLQANDDPSQFYSGKYLETCPVECFVDCISLSSKLFF